MADPQRERRIRYAAELAHKTVTAFVLDAATKEADAGHQRIGRDCGAGRLFRYAVGCARRGTSTEPGIEAGGRAAPARDAARIVSRFVSEAGSPRATSWTSP